MVNIDSTLSSACPLISIPLFTVLTAVLLLSSGVAAEQKTPAPVAVSAAKDYGKLPLSFEENKGQTDPQVRFLSRGNGYSLFLTDGAAVLSLRSGADAPQRSEKNPFDLASKLAKSHQTAAKTDVVRMELAGAAHGSRVTGDGQLPGTANYFIGKDPAKWRSGISTFAKVHYEGVYPGVDLVYYGNQSQLEYDFMVAPNTSPKPIRLHFDGAQELRLGANGDLAVVAESGQVVFHKPVVYQTIDGKRQPVEGSFNLLTKNNVGFTLGRYDTTKQLVIDPILAYSTFLGSLSGSEGGSAIAAGSDGSAYVVGVTSSVDFPITAGAFQSTQKGIEVDDTLTAEAFVAKINPAGNALVYSTYLGGSGNGVSNDQPYFGSGDYAYSIAVDSTGNAYVAGATFSADFPVTSGAFQTTDKGIAYGIPNGFVTKLNPSGTALVYSTYLGGTGLPDAQDYSDFFDDPIGGDFCFHVVVDGSGNAFVTGYTYSADFPIVSGAFQSINMGFGNQVPNAFVTKLNPAGSALVYSTFLGGSDGEAGTGIAVDSEGDAYVGGISFSTDFPVIAGAIQATNKGVPSRLSNGFISKINPTGSGLIYSTYLGGTGNVDAVVGDLIAGVVVDSAKNVYVTGSTFSKDFPVTSGAYQSKNKAFSNDGPTLFVSKINPSGTSLVYSTYLGGSGSEYNQSSGIALDALGNVYLTGLTESTDFPVIAGAFQATSYCGNSGGQGGNTFVTELNPAGSGLVYSSYLGGSGFPFSLAGKTVYLCSDLAEGIALDSVGGLYLTGTAISTDFPTTTGVLQTSKASPTGGVVFVTKFDLSSSTSNGTLTALAHNGNPQAPGSAVTFIAHVQSLSGSGIPTGTVSFSVDGVAAPAVALDSKGRASYTSSSLALGSHPVTATYSADANYTASSGNLNETITAPIGNLETAADAQTGSATVSQSDSLYVGGWAADPYYGTGIFIQVLVDGTPTGVTTTGISRPDVAAYFGKPAYKNSGFSLTYSAASLAVGTHKVTVVATDGALATTTFGPLTVTVTAGSASPPFGNLDLALDDATASTNVSQGDNLFVSGWVADAVDGAPVSNVKVLIDGAAVGTPTLSVPRYDVYAFYNNINYINAGYNLVYPASTLSLGAHSVTVTATDSGGRSMTFGPMAITVVAAAMKPPVGNLEKAVNNATNAPPVPSDGTLLVGGWAADYQDNGAAKSVQIVIDGTQAGFATLGLSRPDVAAAFDIPAWSNTGWSFTYSASTLAKGTHGVTAIAKDSLGLTTTFGPIAFTVQ